MLTKITTFLDELLAHKAIVDYPGAHNGLQLENSGRVARIVSAVDACEAVLAHAARVPGTLLLVHHGLLWSGAQPFTGALRRKLKLALEADLAIYSSHLPLDLHARFGNNALLAKALGLRKCAPAFLAKGQPIGLIGQLPLTRRALVQKLEKLLGSPVHLAPGGPERVRRIGLCSGGAGEQVAQAATLGCDAFITGEGAHHTYTLAEELGVNLLYAGHYATETFGVRALGEHVAGKYNIPFQFIDHPTGL